MTARPTASFLRGLIVSFFGCAVWLAPALAAESPPRPASTDSPITLSPFEVTAQDDGSYLATNTLAGTRFNTALKDVPASITVMTADFLRDVGANNLNDAMAYAIGTDIENTTTANNAQGSDLQLNMRGFTKAVLGRNYFESQTAQDSYNMERATFSRGPNSVMFGSGGAGGIADATTKRAQRNAITEFTNRAGGFDDYRFTLDLNRPISKTLALRLNALDWNRKGWRDFEHMNRRSVALAATWRPLDHTTVRIDTEYGKVDELKLQPWPALDSVSDWIKSGRPVTAATSTVAATQYFITNSNALQKPYSRTTTSSAHVSALAGGLTTFTDQSVVPFSANLMGPGATSNNKFWDAGVFLEQQVTRDLVIELAANQQHVDRNWNRAMNWNNAAVLADPNATLPSGVANPYAGQYYIQAPTRPNITRTNQTWNDYRATATYKFDLKKFGSHQVAGVVSQRDFFDRGGVRTEAWSNNPAQPDLSNATNTIVRRTYLSFNGSSGLPSYFPDPFSSPINTGGVVTSLYQSGLNNTLSRFQSRVAVLQSRFFNDHLVTTFGVRHDEQRAWGSTTTLNPVTKEVLSATRSSNSTLVKGNTRTAGAVLHVLPWISLTANTSNNATPQAFVAFGPNATASNIPLGNRIGNGSDYGVRFTLLDERVHGSVVYFEGKEQNSQRFKQGNLTSGWELWLNQAALALNRPGAYASSGGVGGYYTGEDTVDIAAHGWETEWTINVNRNLRFVLNGTHTISLGSNQWPRITAAAQNLLVDMHAKPTTLVTGVGGATTLGALATIMETQMTKDQLTNGKLISLARPNSGNIVANYRVIEGRLKGLALTLGVNLRGPAVIGYNSVTNQAVMDGDYVQFNPSVTYTRDLSVRGRKIIWNVMLSGTNVLGHRYGLLPTFGDELSIDRYVFETTPTVFLTNRFRF